MLTWYDKLALAGIFVAFIGFVMYFVGLSYMMSANREARAHLRASIQQATEELRKR